LKGTSTNESNKSDGVDDDIDINSLLNDIEVPPEENNEWLRAYEGEPGYR
jgi:hypothetical protein